MWSGVWDGMPRMWWRWPLGGIGVHQLDSLKARADYVFYPAATGAGKGRT